MWTVNKHLNNYFVFISWKGVKFHCNKGRKGTETVTGGGQHILDSFLLPVYSSCFFYFIQSVISTRFAVKIVDLDSGGFPRGLFLFSSPWFNSTLLLPQVFLFGPPQSGNGTYEGTLVRALVRPSDLAIRSKFQDIPWIEIKYPSVGVFPGFSNEFRVFCFH